VEADNGEADGEDCRAAEGEQEGEDDVGGAEGGDDLPEFAGPERVEGPGPIDEGEFEKDEPEAAGEEAAAVRFEARGDAHEQGEDGGAEVGEPAEGEEQRAGLGEVHGICYAAGAGGVFAGVVDDHEDHHQAA
jgi:hypothetical protein